MIFTKSFWKGLAERAVKTFFQSGVATIGVSAGSEALGLGSINWGSVASIAVVATILSVATSIGNADFTAGVDKTTSDVSVPPSL